eukprot:scaffold5.g749.t1
MSSTDSEPLRWPAKQPRAGAREADAAGGAPAAADVIGAPLLAGAGGPPAPAASAQGDEVAAAARPAGEAQETEEPPPGQAPKGVGRSRQRKSKVTCQVAGCGADLAGSKRYYKWVWYQWGEVWGGAAPGRYRICLYHSTLPSIVLDGREQRFCQQCGRFHDMSEFAGKRKSCQRKLDRHNQRRKEREAAGCDGPTGMARSPPADAEGESDAAADFGDPESDPGETSIRRRWQQQQQQEAGGRQQPASAPRQRQQPLLAMSSEELAMLDEFVLGHLDLGSSMEAPLSPAQQPGSLQIAGLGERAAPSPVKHTGYRGFGSFMTEQSVEEMVAAAAAQPGWRPPTNPCAVAPPRPPPAFGAAMRSQASAGAVVRRARRRFLIDFGSIGRILSFFLSLLQFLIDFGSWCFLNAGAFGGVLRPAHEEASAWRARCEAQPLAFLDRELFPQLVRVLAELARLLGCSPADLALLPNATTGLSTVLSSWRGRLGPGDAVFSLDIGYGSVLCEATGTQGVEARVALPVTGGGQLVRQVAEALPPSARLAIFDAVTSNTAVVLPIRELVSLCHSRGVEVLIDGAHAPGMLELDLTQLDADFFVANCHKWLCAPRGSACLWVNPRHRGRVRPLVTSHGHGSGFSSEFIWDGCRDYAPLLGISAALRFWEAVPGGWAAVRAYQRRLLADAVDLLARAFGTASSGGDGGSGDTGPTLVPLSMCGSMALVRLPDGAAAAAAAAGSSNGAPAAGPPPAGSAATSADAKWVQDTLHHQFRIECPVKCVGGHLYVRISAAVYNELGDYQRLADAVLSILKEGTH